MSNDSRVVQTDVNTYLSYDGKQMFRFNGSQWQRFDITYSVDSPIDGAEHGYASLDEVVLAATGEAPVIM